MLENLGLKFHFVLAFLLRIVFTIAGIYIDNNKSFIDNNLTNNDSKIVPKYTDIDYQVFTDAARHVYMVF